MSMNHVTFIIPPFSLFCAPMFLCLYACLCCRPSFVLCSKSLILPPFLILWKQPCPDMACRTFLLSCKTADKLLISECPMRLRQHLSGSPDLRTIRLTKTLGPLTSWQSNGNHLVNRLYSNSCLLTPDPYEPKDNKSVNRGSDHLFVFVCMYVCMRVNAPMHLCICMRLYNNCAYDPTTSRLQLSNM